MAETTRDRLKTLHAANPEWTGAMLARELGVSRERVRQLAVAEGLTLPQYVYQPQPRRERKPPQSRIQTGGLMVPINNVVAGTIAELLVAADLAARGWIPFLPAIRNRGGTDLVAVSRNGMTVERIEVRCGKRNAEGRLVWTKPERAKSDRRAIVLTGEPVVYSPRFLDDT